MRYNWAAARQQRKVFRGWHMDTEYLLRRLHALPGREEDFRVLAIYRRARPGFRDFPDIVDPRVMEEEDGFHIDACQLDKDQ